MADLDSSPVAAGIGLIIAGALLRWLRPAAFEMPKPSAHAGDSPKIPRNRREVRDGVAAALPDNLTDALARTCIMVGGGLLVLRAMDEFMEADDRLFSSASLRDLR